MLFPSEGVALSARTDFVSDVAEYLQRTPRQLPSRYFYDALGSALFDAICRLPWYRFTRAETALLSRYARQILEPLPAADGSLAACSSAEASDSGACI